jgi:hypothetical protein
MDSRHIAEHLLDHEVTGKRGADSQCPLANYFRECVPGCWAVVINGVYVRAYPARFEVQEYHPTAEMRKFMTKFDDGEYPDLVDPDDSWD